MANESKTNAPLPAVSTLSPTLPPQGAKASPAAKTASFLNFLFVGNSKPGEIIVYHHSSLFYWWPVWALGFVMAIITYFSDKHMAIVPAGTIPTTAMHGEALIDGKPASLKDRDILV